MQVKHAGAGIFHHCPDPLPHIRFVTMHSAFRALRFVFLKGAFFKALHSVVQKLTAFRTEPFFITMLSMAEYLNHRLNGSAFLHHSFMVVKPCGTSTDTALRVEDSQQENGCLSLKRGGVIVSHLCQICFHYSFYPPTGRIDSVTWVSPSVAGYRPGARTRRQRPQAGLIFPS